ncbi:MAG: hypothetical protein L6R37_004092 [Teloschistes peruensis]|nr:MAG: hypothetical protein L6R37_004092 [Teloschistes peruensis]
MPKKPLERIEESPQSAFRKTRIPSKSPEYAPTLTVSSSAHRLIMGSDEDQSGKKSKSLLRTALTGEKKDRKSLILTPPSILRPTQGLTERRTSSGIPVLKKVEKDSAIPVSDGMPLTPPSQIIDEFPPRSSSHTTYPDYTQGPSPETPAMAGPSEMDQTAGLAMNLLASARRETSVPQKQRLLDMERVVVDVISHARDAEKTALEARTVAREAQLASLQCERSAHEVAGLLRTLNRGG